MPSAISSVSLPQLLAMAQRHEAEGRLAAAEAAYLKILAVQPAHPDILRALALISHRRRQTKAARRYIERSIEAEPRAETFLILAGLCQAQLQYRPAVLACARAAELAPADPAPWMEMAGIHVAAQDYEAAESALRKALQLRPGLPEAQANLGSVLFSQGRFDEAVKETRTLLAAHPAHAAGWRTLGSAEKALGNFAAARAAYGSAIRCAPDYAEAHRDLALLDLLLGDTKSGFAAYEWRWRATELGAPLLSTPRWNGASNGSGKTILLHFEQGFGDTIQCLRFVPLLEDRFKSVILRVPRPIQKLASYLSGAARVVPDTEPVLRHDVHAYLLSLPHLLGLYGPPKMQPVSYLTPPAGRVAIWRGLLAAGEAKRIGLAWSGNPTHLNDKRRSLPADFLKPLLDLPGCIFYSLHPDAEPPEGIQRLPARLPDFAETAAAIANLDLVISVDTAVAHLAGAIGKPVWILLPAVPDWRWGLTGDTTDWYPSARLYRQESAGDWESLLGLVRTKLERFLA